MAGEDIIELLEKSKVPLCHSEIKAKLPSYSHDRLTLLLARMVKGKYIKVKVVNFKEARTHNNKIKRSLYLYYI